MLRERLGLSPKGTEAAAKAHIEASGWMRDHLTKAVGLHVADEVWQTVDRHLFADSSGRRHGPRRIRSWWDFTRIAGRAQMKTGPHHRRRERGQLGLDRRPEGVREPLRRLHDNVDEVAAADQAQLGALLVQDRRWPA